MDRFLNKTKKEAERNKHFNEGDKHSVNEGKKNNGLFSSLDS